MSFPDWAVDAYERSGASEAALALQDAHGQNVAYLLWAVWAQVRDPILLARGAEVARGWDEAVLKPLRAARRALKDAAPPIGDAARETLRTSVKAAELQAERVLMEALETLDDGARGGAPALEALQAASGTWGAKPPEQALAALAAALR